MAPENEKPRLKESRGAQIRIFINNSIEGWTFKPEGCNDCRKCWRKPL